MREYGQREKWRAGAIQQFSNTYSKNSERVILEPSFVSRPHCWPRRCGGADPPPPGKVPRPAGDCGAAAWPADNLAPDNGGRLQFLRTDKYFSPHHREHPTRWTGEYLQHDSVVSGAADSVLCTTVASAAYIITSPTLLTETS